MTKNLHNLATLHHIHITWHTGGPKGAWLPSTRQISLRAGMSDTQTLCTLAHELGHALQRHHACSDGKQERQADKWAANTLIDVDEYAQAEILHDGHPGAIADELGVTRHIVEAWQSIYENQLTLRKAA